MKTRTETFRKSERLCSKKVISFLFGEGHILYNPLFKIVWSENPATMQFPARVAFSVSKKGFRKATDRNLIRRRMKEAYRKNKQQLYDQLVSLNTRIAFIIIFRGNKIPEYITIEKAMMEMTGKLISAISEKHSKC